MILNSSWMKLVKWCHPQFNIRDGCSKIRIGSFKYYRRMEAENPAADRDEGTHTVTHGNLGGKWLHPSAKEALKPHYGEQTIDLIQNQNFIISDNKFRTIYKNHYIWCSSMNEGTFSGHENCNNYQVHDVHAFFEEMALVLSDNIKISDIVEQPLVQPSQIFRIGVKIEYVKSREEVISWNGTTDYCSPLPKKLWPYSIKSSRFEKEEEFRMIFVLHDGMGTEYEAASDYIDCNVSERLRQLVS